MHETKTIFNGTDHQDSQQKKQGQKIGCLPLDFLRTIRLFRSTAGVTLPGNHKPSVVLGLHSRL